MSANVFPPARFRRACRLLVSGAYVLALHTLTLHTASAQSKTACAEALAAAKSAVSKDRLFEARDAFATCAQDKCPAALRSDCAQGLADVTEQIPSVVLAPRDESGHDITDAQVTLDGKPVASNTGRPVELTPGDHMFRFEAPGRKPVEKKVVAMVGEKTVLVAVTLIRTDGAPAAKGPKEPPPKAATTEPPAGTASPSPPSAAVNAPPKAKTVTPPAPSAGDRSYLPIIALGGAGVAFGVTAVVVGVSAKSDAADLRKRCAPGCTDDDTRGMNTKLLISDITLGASILSFAGAALWFFLDRPKRAHGVIAPPVFYGDARGLRASTTISF